MNNAGVYLIENLVNGKVYCGSSKNLSQRFQHHRWRLRKGTHENPHLQAAYSKYGEESFTYRVVEFVEKEEDLVIREQYWLDQFDKSELYNITKYATPGNAITLTQKHKDKLTAKAKKKVVMQTLDGITIKEFQSISEATKEMNGCVGYLAQLLKKGQRIAYGYRWDYVK